MLKHMGTMSFFDRSRIPNEITYLSGFNVLLNEGVESLLRLLAQEIRKRHVTALVLDGLFVIHDVAGNEPHFRRFVHELQGHAAITGCTMLLLTNHSREKFAPEYTVVDGWLDLLDEMHRVRSVRSIVVRKQRGGPHLRGRHQFRITTNGIEVYPRLEAELSREPAASESIGRVSTGVAGLDQMTKGGYPSGSATILFGPSGSGKTTFGLQFLAECTADSPGVLFGFYETPARLRTKARGVGIDLEGLIKQGAIEVVWRSPAENLSDDLGHQILEVVERRGARRLVVDGINALKHSFIFPDRLPLFLNAINNTLKSRDITVVYTMESPVLFMPEDLHIDDLSSMVDNVLLLHYAHRDHLISRKLAILKIRDSEFDPFPEEFFVTSEGIHFGKIPALNIRPPLEEGTASPPRTGQKPPPKRR
jgi:circadian clock protein KaiC